MNQKLRGSRFFYTCNYIIATFFLIVCLYPLYYVLIASFSAPEAVVKGDVWIWVKDFQLTGYRAMMQRGDIWIGYRNTIIYTFCGTCINLLFTVPAGYVLSRKTLPGRKIIIWYFMIIMFFSGGLIPTYLLIKGLGLVGSPIIVMLLGAVNVWNMTICRTFFENNIPIELIEAAQIDGCSEIGIFAKVTLPLSKAIMAVMTLYFAVAHWNSYYNAMIYLSDKKLYPLQLVLRQLLLVARNSLLDGTEGIDEAAAAMYVQSVQYSIVIVASLPVLIMYPFIQKYFVKGVMIGSVKG